MRQQSEAQHGASEGSVGELRALVSLSVRLSVCTCTGELFNCTWSASYRYLECPLFIGCVCIHLYMPVCVRLCVYLFV